MILKLARRLKNPLLARASTQYAMLMLRLSGATVGEGLRVDGTLRLHVDGTLRVGRRVRINSGPTNNFVGGDRRMALWVGSRGVLEIGDGCALSNSTIVCIERVRILEESFIGGGCEIYDTDFHQLDAEDRIKNRGPVATGPIAIGPRAFVGGWTIVLKGVTIGEGAVVGAGSLVTRSIPPNEIWAGVPARKIRGLS